MSPECRCTLVQTSKTDYGAAYLSQAYLKHLWPQNRSPTRMVTVAGGELLARQPELFHNH